MTTPTAEERLRAVETALRAMACHHCHRGFWWSPAEYGCGVCKPLRAALTEAAQEESQESKLGVGSECLKTDTTVAENATGGNMAVRDPSPKSAPGNRRTDTNAVNDPAPSPSPQSAVLSAEEVGQIERKERGIAQAHEMMRVLDSHEALRAENERLRAELEGKPISFWGESPLSAIHRLNRERDALAARVAELEAERDAWRKASLVTDKQFDAAEQRLRMAMDYITRGLAENCCWVCNTDPHIPRCALAAFAAAQSQPAKCEKCGHVYPHGICQHGRTWGNEICGCQHVNIGRATKAEKAGG